MLLGPVFERFVAKAPFAVMSRSLLERALTPEALDALFEDKANSQYTRELTFSSVVDLMGQVVTSDARRRRCRSGGPGPCLASPTGPSIARPSPTPPCSSGPRSRCESGCSTAGPGAEQVEQPEPGKGAGVPGRQTAGGD